ncbi:MAG: DNA primase [Spirochaetota bacterium]
MISNKSIEYIRTHTRIEEIVLKYVPSLKKRGKNYIGLCPFHKEKTPSFSVSPEKQIFNCFGCNTGGNVITFISKIENLTFAESVKHLAKIAGIEIEYDGKGHDNSSIEQIRRINRYTMNFYHSYLKSAGGEKGLSYLVSRGVDQASIEKFKLGMAPDSWEMLTKSLMKNKADIAICEKIGLCAKSTKNRQENNREHYYDKFRNRVMFPIFDRTDNVAGFGARSIDEKQQPKYLNSSESEVYQKKNILYGLNFAQDEIRNMDRAIIVEGYLDVIGCHQQGLKNVVAPLGTALTENQVRQLSHLCNEIIMLFDSDSAGINAALRSITTSEMFNISIKIALLPNGDPFDYIKAHGLMGLMIIIDKASNPLDFQFQNIIARNKGKDKLLYLKEFFEIIEKLELSTHRDYCFKKINELLALNEESLRIDFDKYLKDKKGWHYPSKEEKRNNKPEHLPYETRLFRDLIELIINNPVITGDVLMDFSPDDFKDPLAKTIFSRIGQIYKEENELKIDKLFDFFDKEIEMDFLNRSIQKRTTIEDPKAAYTEIYVNFKLQDIDNKISKYAEMIKESGSDKLEYLAEIEILRREKEKLSNYIYNRGSLIKN